MLTCCLFARFFLVGRFDPVVLARISTRANALSPSQEIPFLRVDRSVPTVFEPVPRFPCVWCSAQDRHVFRLGQAMIEMGGDPERASRFRVLGNDSTDALSVSVGGKEPGQPFR